MALIVVMVHLRLRRSLVARMPVYMPAYMSAHMSAHTSVHMSEHRSTRHTTASTNSVHYYTGHNYVCDNCICQVNSAYCRFDKYLDRTSIRWNPINLVWERDPLKVLMAYVVM